MKKSFPVALQSECLKVKRCLRSKYPLYPTANLTPAELNRVRKSFQDEGDFQVEGVPILDSLLEEVPSLFFEVNPQWKEYFVEAHSVKVGRSDLPAMVLGAFASNLTEQNIRGELTEAALDKAFSKAEKSFSLENFFSNEFREAAYASVFPRFRYTEDQMKKAREDYEL